MTIISKTAGVLSLASCIHDIHKTALINSKNAYAKASSDAVITSSLGNQKADKISYKDAQRKNWLAQNNFTAPYKEFFARVGGYITGAAKASVRYIPNFALATVALCCKKYKGIVNAAAIGLGAIEGLDFIKNATNINQRTDYLK
jgi:hypothetical protein